MNVSHLCMVYTHVPNNSYIIYKYIHSVTERDLLTMKRVVGE